MPIIKNQPNRDNSPWYKIMESKAIIWNQFAMDNNLDIEGYYNSYVVTFEGQNINNKLNISGYRQVSNVSTLLYPSVGRISEILKVKLDTTIISEKYFIQIYKISIWNLLRKKLKFKLKYKNYYVTFNDSSFFEDLKEIEILEYKDLIKLKINKKGSVLVLYELPNNTNPIKLFLKLINSSLL